jgi:hypothetical protein
VDLQKPVLQARALDLDMVGELELTFEIPLGNALVDQVALPSPLLCLLPRIVNTFSFTSIERSAPAKPATATEMLQAFSPERSIL